MKPKHGPEMTAKEVMERNEAALKAPIRAFDDMAAEGINRVYAIAVKKGFMPS